MKKSEKIQTVILGAGALIITLSTVLSQRKLTKQYEEFMFEEFEDEDE